MRTRKLLFPNAVALLSVLIVSACGGDAPAFHEQYPNASGGGPNRANNFSSLSIPAVTAFTEYSLDSLGSGFRGTPLPTGAMLLTGLTWDRRLVRFRSDSIIWTYQFPENEFPLPECAVNAAGTAFVVTTSRRLTVVDSSGMQLWAAAITDSGEGGEFDLPTWPLALEDGAVAGSTGGILKRFDGAGSTLWSRRFGAQIVPMVAFKEEIGIVAGVSLNDRTKTDTLVCIGTDGAERWRAPLEGTRIEYGPIIADDRVVVGVASESSGGKYRPFVLAFDANGTEVMRAPLDVLPVGISADNDGTLYVSGGGGGRMSGGSVTALDREGTERWQVGFSRAVPSVAVITAEWVHVVAMQERTLGLYTYSKDGAFTAFAPIDIVSDVNPVPAVGSTIGLVIAGRDEPVLLKIASRGIFDFF